MSFLLTFSETICAFQLPLTPYTSSPCVSASRDQRRDVASPRRLDFAPGSITKETRVEQRVTLLLTIASHGKRQPVMNVSDIPCICPALRGAAIKSRARFSSGRSAFRPVSFFKIASFRVRDRQDRTKYIRFERADEIKRDETIRFMGKFSVRP